MLRLSLGLAGLFVTAAQALAQTPSADVDCGSLENAYGPYDYTNAAHRRDYLPVVEEHHINSDVLALRRGMSGNSASGDLQYVLRAFPNHHIALDAMARLHRQEKTERLPGAPYSMTCWFDRAKRMNSGDAMVPLVQGIYLYHLTRYEEAKTAMLAAAALAPESAEVHYNLGLLSVRIGDYSAAQVHADKAYALGFPLPGLRQQLARHR